MIKKIVSCGLVITLLFTAFAFMACDNDDELRQLVDELRGQVVQLQNDLNDANSEIEKLKSSSDSQIKDLEEEIKTLKNQIGVLNGRIDGLVVQLNSLKELLDDQDELIIALQNLIDDLEETLAGLQERFDELYLKLFPPPKTFNRLQESFDNGWVTVADLEEILDFRRRSMPWGWFPCCQCCQPIIYPERPTFGRYVYFHDNPQPRNCFEVLRGEIEADIRREFVEEGGLLGVPYARFRIGITNPPQPAIVLDFYWDFYYVLDNGMVAMQFNVSGFIDFWTETVGGVTFDYFGEQQFMILWAPARLR